MVGNPWRIAGEHRTEILNSQLLLYRAMPLGFQDLNERLVGKHKLLLNQRGLDYPLFGMLSYYQHSVDQKLQEKKNGDVIRIK